MHRQICDLSRENVPYGIRSNGWKRTVTELACEQAEKNPAQAGKTKSGERNEPLMAH